MARHSKKSKIGSLLRSLLMLVLLVVGLLLIFNKSIRNTIIANNTNKYQVSQVSKEKLEENKTVETTFDFEQVESLSTESILKAQMDTQDLPVIGGIAIPELGINLPIFKGMGNTELSYGAGTMKPEQEMGKGNYALASHHVFGLTGSSQMLFSPLDRATEGMIIYLTDKEKIYTYVIDEIVTVTPDHVEVIDDVPGKTQVTLVTCDDLEATGRIIVHASFKEEVSFDKATSEMVEAFEVTYNQMVW